MISILVSTRNRQDMFKIMFQSVLDTAFNKSNIEFSVYRDDDDNSIYEYPPNCKETRGKRINPELAINECQKIATGPYYIFIPDDLIFETRDWDKQVIDEFDKCKDKILLVHFNDHNYKPNWGTAGCLHKNWIDTVGYMMPPELCRHGDAWLHEVGKQINRRVFLPDVFYKDYKIKNDQTHLEYSKEIERTNPKTKYFSREMRKARKRDAKKLQDFIDNFKQ